jgi:DNA-binding SARP family transcriptional activator/tetratricopeptide (TPR) repeat protein
MPDDQHSISGAPLCPPTPLQIRLLGPGHFLLGEPLRFPYAKAQALLLMLLLEPAAQPRARLTEMLWPGQALVPARNNLRNALHALRRMVGEHRIMAAGSTIRWVAQPGDEIDLHGLAGPPQVGQLALLAHYQGEMLAGYYVPDAPGFNDWLDARRLACQGQAMACTDRLFDHALATKDAVLCLQIAQLQARMDPWNEALQARLIRLLAESGQAGAAQAQWEMARDALQRDLDASPGEALQGVAAQLRQGLSPSTAVSTESASTLGAASEASMVADDAAPFSSAALLHMACRAKDPRSVSAAHALRQLHEVVMGQAADIGAHVRRLHGGGYLLRVDAQAGRSSLCERALRAASGVVAFWRGRAPCSELALCLAIHRGPLLPPEGDLLDPLGHVASLVAAMALSGGEGEVLVSPAVAHRLASEPWVAWHRPVHLAGQADWAAMRWAGQAVAAPQNDGPLLGRQPLQTQLRRAWDQVGQGQARARLLSGLPGAGKSRLVRWARTQLVGDEHTWVIDCLPSRRESPGAPLVQWLAKASGVAAQPQARLPQLTAWLQELAPGMPAASQRALACLLELAPTEDAFTPTRRRKDLLDAFIALVRGRLSSGPLLLVVEDVHWADATTLAILEALPGQVQGQALMVLATARPSEEPWLPWARLEVPALSAAKSRELLSHVLASAPTDLKRPEERVLAHILERAQGNPLFIESLVRAAVQVPGGEPHNLEDGLLALVANDPYAREVLHAASVLGEEFHLPLLQRLCAGQSQDALHDALRRLRRHGLVFMDGDVGRFRHALIRDAIYGGLPDADRQQWHARVIDCAQQLDPEMMAGQPLWFARHAERAGQVALAVDCFEQAARQSLAIAAFAEAAERFGAGLDLLERRAPHGHRSQSEHARRLALGRANATVPLCGYGAQETRSAFQKVLDIGGGTPGNDQVFLAYYGLWLGGSSQGGYRQALQHVQRLQDHAQLSGRPIHAMQCAYAWGNTFLWLGELASARPHLEHALALCAEVTSQEVLQHYSEDTGVIAAALLAWACWLEGDTQVALDHQAFSLARAASLDHPYSMAFALACAARFAIMRGESEVVGPLVDQLDALADKHELGLWRALVAVERGWLWCAEGRQEGAELAGQGVALGAPALPALEVTLLSMQADGLYRLGRRAECARVVDHALQRCNHWDDRYMQPELLRLAALCASDGTAASQCRARARAQAMAQGAQAWLARL